MKELLEYRVKLLERFREAAQEFRTACEEAGDPAAKVDGEWTVQQIAVHTRDVSRFVYGARVHQTILEENPSFTNFDADKWMLEHYDPQESLSTILSEFTTYVEELCVMLESQPREAWSRVSRHEIVGGGLTMQLWVERNLAHIEEHLRALKKMKNK